MPRLLEAMDKGRVDHVMLSGVAVAKKWHEDEPKRRATTLVTMPEPIGTAPPT